MEGEAQKPNGIALVVIYRCGCFDFVVMCGDPSAVAPMATKTMMRRMRRRALRTRIAWQSDLICQEVIAWRGWWSELHIPTVPERNRHSHETAHTLLSELSAEQQMDMPRKIALADELCSTDDGEESFQSSDNSDFGIMPRKVAKPSSVGPTANEEIEPKPVSSEPNDDIAAKLDEDAARPKSVLNLSAQSTAAVADFNSVGPRECEEPVVKFKENVETTKSVISAVGKELTAKTESLPAAPAQKHEAQSWQLQFAELKRQHEDADRNSARCELGTVFAVQLLAGIADVCTYDIPDTALMRIHNTMKDKLGPGGVERALEVLKDYAAQNGISRDATDSAVCRIIGIGEEILKDFTKHQPSLDVNAHPSKDVRRPEQEIRRDFDRGFTPSMTPPSRSTELAECSAGLARLAED